MNKFLSFWKTTVHLTYDRDGEFVGSYVDDNTRKASTDWVLGEEKKMGDILYVAYNQKTGRQVIMGFGAEGKRKFKQWVGSHKLEWEKSQSAEKGIFPSFQISKPGPSIHTDEWNLS